MPPLPDLRVLFGSCSGCHIRYATIRPTKAEVHQRGLTCAEWDLYQVMGMSLISEDVAAKRVVLIREKHCFQPDGKSVWARCPICPSLRPFLLTPEP